MYEELIQKIEDAGFGHIGCSKYRMVLDLTRSIENVDAVFPYGSRFTSPEDDPDDWDVLVFSRKHRELREHLEDTGWERSSDSVEGKSLKKVTKSGKIINVVVCSDAQDFMRRASASVLCKLMSNMNKDDRYEVHAIIADNQ